MSVPFAPGLPHVILDGEIVSHIHSSQNGMVILHDVVCWVCHHLILLHQPSPLLYEVPAVFSYLIGKVIIVVVGEKSACPSSQYCLHHIFNCNY